MIATALLLTATLAGAPEFKTADCKRAAADSAGTIWSAYKPSVAASAGGPAVQVRFRYVIVKSGGKAWCNIDRIEWRSAPVAARTRVAMAWDLVGTQRGGKPGLLAASANSPKADDALAPAPSADQTLDAGARVDLSYDMNYVSLDAEQPFTLTTSFVKPKK